MVVVRGSSTTIFNAKSSELNNYFRLREVSLSFCKQINKPLVFFVFIHFAFIFPNANGGQVCERLKNINQLQKQDQLRE